MVPWRVESEWENVKLVWAASCLTLVNEQNSHLNLFVRSPIFESLRSPKCKALCVIFLHLECVNAGLAGEAIFRTFRLELEC